MAIKGKTISSSMLVISGAKGDTRRYRIFNLYQQLRLAGADVGLAHLTDPRLAQLAGQVGVMVLHRVPCDSYIEQIIDRVQARGGTVLVDTDDLIFDPQAFQLIDSPDFSDPVRAGLYQENMRRHRRTLEKSDAALASTEFLAERVRALGKPCQVHRNAFNLELGALSQAAYESRMLAATRVVIGYASGTPTHNLDFALVRPALINVLERFPQAELWLLGAIDAGKEWGSAGSRVRRIPLVPWRELPGLLAHLDINVAPLVMDNPFSQSKSEIKYMEAGLVGVPTIASPTAAFRHAIRHGENGLLAADEDVWVAHLASLVTDPLRRQALGEAARRHVLEEYHPLKRATELRGELAEIGLQTGRPDLTEILGQPVTAVSNADLFTVPIHFEQHPTLLEMGLYSIRRGEYLRLLGMIWVQIRRLLAPVFPFK
jgi:glycosyltransferase involved in cell wall biosynthesis